MKSFSTYGRKSPRFTHVIDEMPASTRSEEGFPGCGGGRQRGQRRGAINEHLKDAELVIRNKNRNHKITFDRKGMHLGWTEFMYLDSILCLLVATYVLSK